MPEIYEHDHTSPTKFYHLQNLFQIALQKFFLTLSYWNEKNGYGLLRRATCSCIFPWKRATNIGWVSLPEVISHKVKHKPITYYPQSQDPASGRAAAFRCFRPQNTGRPKQEPTSTMCKPNLRNRRRRARLCKMKDALLMLSIVSWRSWQHKQQGRELRSSSKASVVVVVVVKSKQQLSHI